MPGLYWNTVNGLLKNILQSTMGAPEFDAFRLVGGTSLSLQFGHRLSIDIDLFTEEAYESIDFNAIDKFFKNNYPYATTNGGQIAMGTSYFAGTSEREAVKIDIYYVDPFIRPVVSKESIRLASVEDIIAMKLEIISRRGRKKDFWDLHELSDWYDIATMITFHRERYPYNHDEDLIRAGLIDFTEADDDFDPECLKGKHWELIKLDFVTWV